MSLENRLGSLLLPMLLFVPLKRFKNYPQFLIAYLLEFCNWRPLYVTLADTLWGSGVPERLEITGFRLMLE